jgi:threonine dehydratase
VKPDAKLYGCEAENITALTASSTAGRPVEVELHPLSIGGIGLPFFMPEIWDLVKRLHDGSLLAGIGEPRDSIKLMTERFYNIAEGAAAVPVAIALSGKAGSGEIACVVSGGNIGIE